MPPQKVSAAHEAMLPTAAGKRSRTRAARDHQIITRTRHSASSTPRSGGMRFSIHSASDKSTRVWVCLPIGHIELGRLRCAPCGTTYSIRASRRPYRTGAPEMARAGEPGFRPTMCRDQQRNRLRDLRPPRKRLPRAFRAAVSGPFPRVHQAREEEPKGADRRRILGVCRSSFVLRAPDVTLEPPVSRKPSEVVRTPRRDVYASGGRLFDRLRKGLPVRMVGEPRSRVRILGSITIR